MMRIASRQIVMPAQKIGTSLQTSSGPLPPIEQLGRLWFDLQSRSNQRRGRGLIRTRSLHLHSPGIEQLDELTIEFNAAAGHRQYNFLAGDALYKRRLATQSEHIVWAIIRRKRVRFQIENYLKRSLRSLRQLASSPAADRR